MGGVPQTRIRLELPRKLSVSSSTIVAARQIWERQTWRHTTPGGSHQFPICVKTAWSEIQSSFRETELDTDLIYPVKVNFWGVSDLVQEIVLACVFLFVAWGLTLCTMFR